MAVPEFAEGGGDLADFLPGWQGIRVVLFPHAAQAYSFLSVQW
jgi:hypothetical protein